MSGWGWALGYGGLAPKEFETEAFGSRMMMPATKNRRVVDMRTQDAPNPQAVAEASALAQSVAEALSGLPEREQRILRLRFGIGGAAEHTLEEVDKIFGLTRERIRQIEASLRKLRQPTRGRKLAAFAQA